MSKIVFYIEFTKPDGEKRFVGSGSKIGYKPPTDRNLYANKQTAEKELKNIRKYPTFFRSPEIKSVKIDTNDL